MTASRAGTSRASSVRPASAARTIQKRRDKPYKTEQSRIIAKKRKLDLHVCGPRWNWLLVLTVGLDDIYECTLGLHLSACRNT